MASEDKTEIRAISIKDVRSTPGRFNTNNHWDNGLKPDDYNSVIEKTYTKHWVNQFHDTFFKFEITGFLFKCLKDCHRIGTITGRVPKSYDEEIESISQFYEGSIVFNTHPGYFIRTENVSLKTGIHGKGPYTNIKSIIQSMVTCRETHSPFYSDDQKSIVVYALPWKDINEFKEFRVFVNSGKLTAISQQNIYKVNSVLCDYPLFDKSNITMNQQSNDDMCVSDNLEHDQNQSFEFYNSRQYVINKWITKINNYYIMTIRPRIKHIDSYVMDISLIGNTDTPYFIEINPFGKQYTSGSALFNWIDNENILNDPLCIHFRYVAY